jgi:glycosyltransferase involved in cell wall biosynthesis
LTSGPRAIRFFARRVLGRASAIGVLSSEEKASFVAAGVPEEKLHLVRNALPMPSAPPTSSREAFIAGYDLPPTTPLVLFISRLIPTKGLLDVVRACGILRDRDRPVVLCCVGDGPAREEAEAEAATLRLGGNARFFGYLPESEAAAFYRYSDVLAFPTFHDEGLPIVLLNALAAGLPIVTTPTRAAVDYLAEPDTCLWVEPHHPEQVADRLGELLADERLRAAMGARAREQARAFDPANVAHDYLDLYQRLLAPVRSAAGGVEQAPVADPDPEAPS